MLPPADGSTRTVQCASHSTPTKSTSLARRSSMATQPAEDGLSIRRLDRQRIRGWLLAVIAAADMVDHEVCRPGGKPHGKRPRERTP